MVILVKIDNSPTGYPWMSRDKTSPLYFISNRERFSAALHLPCIVKYCTFVQMLFSCEGNAVGSCRSNPNQGGAFESGSVCNGNVAQSCAGYFQAGSVCHGYAANSCSRYDYVSTTIFEEGARCVAHVAGACNGDYSRGGCCEGGDNCPANAPRC